MCCEHCIMYQFAWGVQSSIGLIVSGDKCASPQLDDEKSRSCFSAFCVSCVVFKCVCDVLVCRICGRHTITNIRKIHSLILHPLGLAEQVHLDADAEILEAEMVGIRYTLADVLCCV